MALYLTHPYGPGRLTLLQTCASGWGRDKKAQASPLLAVRVTERVAEARCKQEPRSLLRGSTARAHRLR